MRQRKRFNVCSLLVGLSIGYMAFPYDFISQQEKNHNAKKKHQSASVGLSKIENK